MYTFRSLAGRGLIVCILTIFLYASPCWAEDAGIDPDATTQEEQQKPSDQSYIGGYLSFNYQNDQNSSSTLSLKDASLFLHWEGKGKFRFFSEIDLESPLTIQKNAELTTKNSYVALERLYFDYLFSDALNFRAGKFLTPVGRWNTIHADPLVWTTTRPLVSERSFPTNATGAMVFGTLPVFGKSVDFSLYSALGEDWRPNPKLDPFEEAYGLHINTSLTQAFEIGISYINFEQRGSIGERKQLFGLDYVWSRNRYEISAEAVYRFSELGNSEDERAAYLQSIFPLTQRLYLVTRYEYYDQAGPVRGVNLYLLGLAFKPSSSAIFKVEFTDASKGNQTIPRGVNASYSVLF